MNTNYNQNSIQPTIAMGIPNAGDIPLDDRSLGEISEFCDAESLESLRLVCRQSYRGSWLHFSQLKTHLTATFKYLLSENPAPNPSTELLAGPRILAEPLFFEHAKVKQVIQSPLKKHRDIHGTAHIIPFIQYCPSVYIAFINELFSTEPTDRLVGVKADRLLSDAEHLPFQALTNAQFLSTILERIASILHKRHGNAILSGLKDFQTYCTNQGHQLAAQILENHILPKFLTWTQLENDREAANMQRYLQKALEYAQNGEKQQASKIYSLIIGYAKRLGLTDHSVYAKTLEAQQALQDQA